MVLTLRAARVQKGLTQKEAAKVLGISDQTLSNYERGNSFPDISQVQEIAKLYGISISEIDWYSAAAPRRKTHIR